VASEETRASPSDHKTQLQELQHKQCTAPLQCGKRLGAQSPSGLSTVPQSFTAKRMR